MKTVILSVAVACLIGAGQACAEPQTYKIDPVHSSLLFQIRHLYTMFTGRINGFSGTISGDPDDPSTMKVVADVDILSIDTASEARDKHLKAPDFFDAERFGVARFESTRTEVTGKGTANVTGNLTLRGVTKEVIFSVEYLGHGPDHRDGNRAGFHAETTLDRTVFGIGSVGKLPSGETVLGTEVKLILEIEAIEQKAATEVAEQ